MCVHMNKKFTGFVTATHLILDNSFSIFGQSFWICKMRKLEIHASYKSYWDVFSPSAHLIS